LFLAEENEQGALGPLVGSATPSVVAPGTTVEVTFLVTAEGVTDWWIFVNPGSDNAAMLAGIGVPPTCAIHVNEEGGAGWICGS
jgi:hypothetical protein